MNPLSCYTGALAAYLAPEFDGTEAWLAQSMRLAVRTDLADGLAFSHHRYPLHRLPDGSRLRYASAGSAAEAIDGICAELAAHGRVVVVVDNAGTPWSPSYGGPHHAPHWIVLDGEWHVLDPFTGLLPGGEQQPYEGGLTTAQLVEAMTLPGWTQVQRRRDELAFGVAHPPPKAPHVWLVRDPAPAGEPWDEGGASGAPPGQWRYGDEALRFLAGWIAEHGAAAEPHLDDLWAAARHQAFRQRWLGRDDAAAAWEALPGALRFAVDSARRGRPRASLVRTTFDHLIGTARPEAMTMTSRTLYDWFRRSAEAYPDNVALEVLDDSLTYAELTAAAERAGAALTEAAGARPDRVGLLSSRSLACYAAYLGALRIGATVVPLNPTSPAKRNLAITAEARLDVVVVDDWSGDGLDEYRAATGVPVLDLTGDRWRRLLDPDATDAVPPAVERGPDDHAYIIFTSGTTGKPKGVPATHANVSSFIEAIQPRYRFTPDSRVPQTFELAFDGSLLTMFGAWAAGATLCVAQRADVLAPVRFIKAKRLTHWMSVPPMISFARRTRALAPGSLPMLQVSSFGGEPLTMDHVRAWTAAAPNSGMINCYGPTETTCIVTAYWMPPGGAADLPATSNGSVPIGDIYDHLDWVLLDERLRPTDDGELCLRGAQRFPGYLDPAENVGRFVAYEPGDLAATPYDGGEPLTPRHWYRTGDRVRREHGELVHMGRIDTQIKVRGNRVELGEIEAALRRHPSVAEAAVITVTATDGEIDLHAFYSGGELSDDELVRLVEQLPPYMRPQRFHHRAEIPLNDVDKVDRRRLAAEFEAERVPS